MKLNLRLAYLLLFATPIVAGEAIAVLPCHATTLAFSEATLELNNFSHPALDVKTLTDLNVFTSATDGSVAAKADATAVADFDPKNPPQFFSSFSNAQGNGQGRAYLGLAQSSSAIIGFNFSVGKNETFSFDLNSLLNLQTSIDAPQFESASATGNISLQLFDSSNGDILDSLTISGNLPPLGNGKPLTYEKSPSITFNPSKTSFDSFFNGTQGFVSASAQGKYSRYFTNPTSITLIEFERSEAKVQAVPEPSGMLSLLFWLIGVGYGVRTKALGAKSKLSQQLK